MYLEPPRAQAGHRAQTSPTPCTTTGLDAAFVLGVFDELIEVAPVLIVVDELGKNLEFAAEHAGNDLYLLQQLAERVSSRSDFSGGAAHPRPPRLRGLSGGSGDARRPQ